MDGFVLRIIAMATMLLDHIGWNFMPSHMTLTWIGRIAFPLYAFLLAEGFTHIRHDQNRLNRHLITLLILTVVSEYGYDLMEYQLDVGSYLESQNNILTLLLGFTGMLLTEALLPSERKEQAGEAPVGLRFAALGIAYGLLGFANYMMKGNFNLVGPLMVIAFYWYLRLCRRPDGTWHPWVKRMEFLLMILVCYLPFYFWVRCGFGDASAWWEHVKDYAPWIAGHLLAILIISLYNGRLGYHEKWFGRLYTSFYPLHIYIIGIISTLVG